jgi:hypothetical protein
MNTHVPNRISCKVGYFAAILAAVFSITYDVGQLAEWLGLLGSAGGPESASTALGIVVLLLPSLLLGPAFVLMILALHHQARAEHKILTHAALIFATVYLVMISMNYFVQLTYVLPHMISGELESVAFALFKPFDSFLYSVDILGYSFMSLATLFAAFAFTGKGVEERMRISLLINGLLIPFIALQNYYHPLIWGASIWAISFPASAIYSAKFFKQSSPPPSFP